MNRLMRRDTGRWLTLMALATVLPAWGQATQPTDGRQIVPLDGGDDGPTQHVKPDEKPVEDKRDRTDPTDVRNVLDDASLLRGERKAVKVDKKGLWQELLAKPFLEQVPAVKAERLLFHGQYPEAEKLFEKVLAEGKLSDEEKRQANEGRLEAILRQGMLKDVKRFLDGVAALPAADRETPRMISLRAEALELVGQMNEARDLLKGAADRHEKLKVDEAAWIHLYNQFGAVLEAQGQYPAAIKVYERVVKLAEDKLPDDPAAQTAIAEAIYAHAVLTGQVKERVQDVNRRFQEAAKLDRTYWPAYLAMARTYLNAHNAKDGGEAVNDTLNLNPNNLEARILALNWAIETYNFDAASTQLDEIKSLADTANVFVAEGRLLLKQRQPDKAIEPLKGALKRNPALPEARGLLAAAYILTADPKSGAEQLAAARTLEGGPHPVALYEAAEVLRDARQFEAAEKLYGQVRQAASWWAEPSAGLGELYMETGQEDKAKLALDEAFKLDPFNMRALNQLRLLDILRDPKNFQTRETANFVIRYHPDDQILADLAADWLEKVYPEVTGYFQTQLQNKTIIEFFPSHEEFGVRTTGLPWIGTVGACTGNVIAMDVPRGGAKDMMGSFDWARVLRHEFTHTVTLAMTGNRIPHWLTEAAAVSQEEAPRDWDNAQMLAFNYRAGTLFKLQDLTWGFIRPKRSTDRRLAYMESQWIYEYLMETYGHQKMIDFLHAFRDGKTEGQAFAAVYGKPMGEINDGFLKWAGKQVEAWGLPTDPLPKQADAEKAVAEKPKDVEARCALASLLMINGGRDALPKAEKLLREAIALDAKHVRARELLGVILNVQRKKAEARKVLEGVVQDDPARPVTLRTLGLMAMQDKRFDDAEKYFAQLQQVRPLEDTSYTNLAGIYLLRNEPAKAIAQLRELQAHEQKDERVARKLAELLRLKKDYKEAESMAYKAIRINPYSGINHQLMANILMDEKEPAKAVGYYKYATEMQPKIAPFWAGLADARGAAGDAAGAAEAAQKAVELDANSPAKKWIKP